MASRRRARLASLVGRSRLRAPARRVALLENLPGHGFLTALLKALIESFPRGHASPAPELMGLLTILTGLEVLIAGCGTSTAAISTWQPGDQARFGITVLGIVTEWPRLVRIVVKTFIHFWAPGRR